MLNLSSAISILPGAEISNHFFAVGGLMQLASASWYVSFPFHTYIFLGIHIAGAI